MIFISRFRFFFFFYYHTQGILEHRSNFTYFDNNWLCFCFVFPGFRGKQCEENIDDCLGHHCQNNATCIDDVNRYNCMCPPTFTGEMCSDDLDECALRPSVCQNGATCTNTHGGFSCICVNGWTGPDCSKNIDDCAGAACFNGATCIDRVGSFYCRCTPGKTGKPGSINRHTENSSNPLKEHSRNCFFNIFHFAFNHLTGLDSCHKFVILFNFHFKKKKHKIF